uniref:Signal recognition particle receptor subunit alpha homolog n=3 Tax=Emiliania huxleyi TaxID=2903 RepID=A0A0D3KKM8_EMIH1
MSKLVGGGPVTAEAMAPVLKALLDRLVEKNVAQEVGAKVIDAVGASLVGASLPTFGSLASTVKAAMAEAFGRVLTSPREAADLLHDVSTARGGKRPYVVVFVGVNGVGKSTSLSKVAYYIKSNGFVPLLCACDTFRSGAVEQLRVHAQALDVPLFQKGYGNDAAQIAADGIAHAQAMGATRRLAMGYDAVLVDTAGRMQDNEPLMRALAKLVHVNSPDLVLFVGEALAGNDAVTGFNASLAQYAGGKAPRLIDGVILTKFDTINDKVGAALNLVYTTGKPVVFVGVGQTYEDIRNLNVEHVVRALTG